MPNNTGHKPRYVIDWNKDADGVSILRRDGAQMTDDELLWVKELIRLSLRAAAQTNAPRSNASKSSKHSEADELVHFLVAEHKRRQLPMSTVAKAMFVDPTTFTRLSRGVNRSFLDVIRPWAHLLGYSIVPVPYALRYQVEKLIQDWVAAGRPHLISSSDEV